MRCATIPLPTTDTPRLLPRSSVTARDTSPLSWLPLLLLLGSLARCHSPSPDAPPEIVVSAASSLSFALPELGAAFEAATGARVVFNTGSTGQLAHQIERGAPVDVFVAADLARVEALAGQGLLVTDSARVYARGALVLWTARSSGVDLRAIGDLRDVRIRRVALANPDHAPYGIAARDALRAAGLWDALHERLVLGENVRQALQYAEDGDVDVALVPRALALRTDGRWIPLPAGLHPPIEQAAAVVADARRPTLAARFVDLLVQGAGQAILRRHGFDPPAEARGP